MIVNDHPFRCNGCGSAYRKHRYAARCCKIGSITDDGSLVPFSAEFEAAAVAKDYSYWESVFEQAHYECACGESFNEVAHAIQCRKCRVTDGCTTVTNRNTGEVVWSAESYPESPTEQDNSRLTYRPFAGL